MYILKEDVMKTYIINSNCVCNEGKYELRTVSNSQVIKMTADEAKMPQFIEISSGDCRQKITLRYGKSKPLC